jgi:hypothetical protein
VDPALAHVLVSVPLFALDAALLAALRAWRDGRRTEAIEQAHDAFCLDPGLGTPTYLTADGRILWADLGWGREGTRGDALAAIRVGARKTGIEALLRLMPPRPPSATICPRCRGTGWDHVEDRQAPWICPACGAVGWTDPSLPLDELVLAK